MSQVPRRKVLVGEIADELRWLLFENAQSLEVTIEALEMMPDQVHLFSKSDPAEAPQHLANQLKGYISQMLRQKFPERRFRMPSVEQKRRRWFDRPGLRENRQAIHRNAAVE